MRTAVVAAAALAALTACTSPGATPSTTPTASSSTSPSAPAPSVTPTPAPAASSSQQPSTSPQPSPAQQQTPAPQAAAAGSSGRAAPGNPAGTAVVPADARPADTTHPDHVIGDGTPASCTSAAVVAAVAAGGTTVFSCGPAPVTIVMASTAKVVNAHPDVVLDGGGLVTLSGGGTRRILYLNTCDQAQGWTTSHCQDQDHPHLTVQNLTFADGSSVGQTTDGGGGGAIFARGGRLTVLSSTFVRNRCDPTGPDVGGAAIRALGQYHGLPAYVVRSTFGGAAGQGGSCANGGAISSIGVSWVVLNSVMSHNEAIGTGANPARAGTPGGGSGGAIYADGTTFTVRVAGSVIEDNHAHEGGGAIFFVSNDRTGTLSIESSTLRRNPNDGFQTVPGIFYLGTARDPQVTGSTVS